MASDVTSISVTCTTNTYTIGGTVSGLASMGLALRNDDNPAHTSEFMSITANGNFTFSAPIPSGDPYGIGIQTPAFAPAQMCTVTNGSGKVGASDITTVQVICQPPIPADPNTLLMTSTSVGGTVYDRVHKYLFVTVTNLNRVDVFSTLDDHFVAGIPVPKPMGIDVSADCTRVVVGTNTQEFFFIDTGRLQVINQVPVPSQFYPDEAPRVVALPSNGNVLLATVPMTGSGISRLLEWQSSTGQIAELNDNGQQVGGPAYFASSADRNKILISGILYDANSDSLSVVSPMGSFANEAANPNGTQFAMNSGNTLFILDANLNVIQTIPSSLIEPSGQTPNSLGKMAYSPDGRYLFVGTTDRPSSSITVLDAAGFKVLGSVTEDGSPSNGVFPASVQLSVDENGVLFDALINSVEIVPTLTAPGFPKVPALANDPLLIHVLPPGGVVENVGAFPVGGLTPQVGLTALNTAPPSGGTETDIYTYGLYDPSSAEVQVTIGGAPATITGGIGSTLLGFMGGEAVRVPPGSPGLQDVTVSTPSGATTVHGAFDYLGDLRVVPLSAPPWQIVSDPVRKQIYISDTAHNRVDVYSLSSKQFLPPIPVGPSPRGISLTPDGSMLVVANSGNGTVSIVNPDQSSASTLVQVVPTGTLGVQPYEVETTNANKALVLLNHTFSSNCCSYDTPEVLDLASQQVTVPPIPNNYSSASILTRVNGGASMLCTCGAFGFWNAALDTFTPVVATNFGEDAASDLSISGDGNVFVQGSNILNPQFVVSGGLATWDFLNYPYELPAEGGILNSSGSLVFGSEINSMGVRVYDVNHGDLRQEISLPEQIQATVGSPHVFLWDEAGDLFILTKSGLTFLNFVVIPLSVGHLEPNQGPASGGTTVTIRGSGFEPDSQVSFDGQSASATIVDNQTLKVVTPQMPVGPLQVTVKNADGQTYSLDECFAAQ